MVMKNRHKIEKILVRLFGSTSRPRILSLLINHPHQAFYQREIMYETGLSLQAVQRELENLLNFGILKKRETKAKIYSDHTWKPRPVDGNERCVCRRQKNNFKEMLKRVQHDSKRGIPHSCHPEPGPELASGSNDFGISVFVLNHLGFKAPPCGR